MVKTPKEAEFVNRTMGFEPGAPAPKRKRHIGRTIVAAIVGLFVVGIVVSALNGSGDQTSPGGNTTASQPSNGISSGLGTADATADVAIDKGSATGENLGGTGIAKATLTITNNSSKRSDYYIEASLLNSAGDNIGTANALVSAVEPSQVAHAELDGTYTGKLDTVQITQVQRTASA